MVDRRFGGISTGHLISASRVYNPQGIECIKQAVLFCKVRGQTIQPLEDAILQRTVADSLAT